MTLFIDTHGSPTGRRLFETGHFARWGEDTRAQRGDVILKWGRGLGGYPANVKRLNPVITSDKLYQGERIAGAGVPIPKIYREYIEWAADEYPDLLKKPREGEGGRGITLCRLSGPKPGWRYENIYMKYIPKQREFRALQIGNLTAYIMEKRPPNGDLDVVCWNLHQGATWHRVFSGGRLTGVNRSINDLATKALAAINYDFAGVDLIEGRDGTLYVIECNSRPGLGEENIRLFINTLLQFVERLRGRNGEE